MKKYFRLLIPSLLAACTLAIPLNESFAAPHGKQLKAKRHSLKAKGTRHTAKAKRAARAVKQAAPRNAAMQAVLPECPGPSDYTPAYSLADISAAVIANPAAQIRLCNDIDAQNALIDPIGYDRAMRRVVHFAGSFEGNNFEIRNFQVNGTGLIGGGNSFGLFLRVTGTSTQRAEIRNLTLRNGSVAADEYEWSNDGVLAGILTHTNIQNVKIHNSRTTGYAVWSHGLLAGAINFSNISDVFLEGTVGADLPRYSAIAGGATGYCDDSTFNRIKLAVTVENGIYLDQSNSAGGLIGESRRVQVSNITGNAVVHSAASGGTGGVIGRARVSTEISDVDLSVDIGNRLILSGTLEGTPAAYPSLAGGIIAQNEGPLFITKARAKGTIRARRVAGGILGYQYDTEDPIGPGVLHEVAFEGQTVSPQYAGGIVGQRAFGQLDIANAYVRADLDATEVAGGIVGDIALDSFFPDFYEPVSIVNTYFAGSIAPNATARGGILGVEPQPMPASQVNNSYYDSDLFSHGTNSLGTPAAGADMRSMQSLYQGWDFQTIWSFTNGQYPRLRTLKNVADTNNDGIITVQDLLSFLQHFFAGNAEADLNGDESVTVIDLFRYLEAYFGRA